MKNNHHFLLIILFILFIPLLNNCKNIENINTTQTIDIYNSWTAFQKNKTYENCKQFKEKVLDFDFSNFEFYPEVLKNTKLLQIQILNYCDSLLTILKNSSAADNSNLQKIYEISNQINILIIDYLRNQNHILNESQQKFSTFYSMLIIIVIIGTCILMLLNERQLKQKNTRISQSETMLRHTMEVQESERARISRELHDTVAQSMRYVSLLAEKISDTELAEKIISTQNANIEDIRKLCYNLTPPNFQNTDLIESLNILAKKIFNCTETQIRIVTNGEITFSNFSNEQLINIYRIIQEIFQNIFKYAHASEITVLFRKEEKLKIIITDDGIGMDTDLIKQINSKSISLYKQLHFGLKNILERIQLLNGKIEYNSTDDFGTSIIIEL